MKYKKLEDFIEAVNASEIDVSNLEIYLDNDEFYVYENNIEIYRGFPDFGLLLALILPKAHIEDV